MDTALFHPYTQLAATLISRLPEARDGAHDLSHLARVWRNAKFIQSQEGGDLEIIAAAVLLHDSVAIPKDSPLRREASKLAAAESTVALEALEWNPLRIQIVAAAIQSHSYSAGIPPTSLEGCILQDADRLDAIGLIGIARCFYTAGRLGSLLYDPSDPAARTRVLDDRRFALDHFPNKLLTLASGFKTATGRKLAQDRHRLLTGFYQTMLTEIEGEPTGS